MKRIYAEVGFGNKSFLSTEIEEGNREFRVRGFKMPEKIEEVYFRFWVFKRVLIISFFKGIFLRRKKENKFKILLGIGGFAK